MVEILGEKIYLYYLKYYDYKKSDLQHGAHMKALTYVLQTVRENQKSNTDRADCILPCKVYIFSEDHNF